MSIAVHEGWATTPDNVQLYYLTRGEGTCLAFCNGIGVSAASFWHGISRPLSKYYKTLNWDYQGHGRSEDPKDPALLDIPTCARDLALILDKQGIEKVILVGHSMGVQVTLEFYRMYPERVLAIIPVLGTFGHPFNNFLRFRRSPEVLEFITSSMLSIPEKAQKLWPFLFHPPIASPFARLTKLVHRTMFPRDELDLYLRHLQRISPVVMSHLARHMQAHSAEDILEDISVPTLIFAGENDIFTPIESSIEMFERIPNAEIQKVREGSHAALVEQPDLFWLKMFHFLSERLVEEPTSEESTSEE